VACDLHVLAVDVDGERPACSRSCDQPQTAHALVDGRAAVAKLGPGRLQAVPQSFSAIVRVFRAGAQQ
jgi:hypothetical protein